MSAQRLSPLPKYPVPKLIADPTPGKKLDTALPTSRAVPKFLKPVLASGNKEELIDSVALDIPGAIIEFGLVLLLYTCCALVSCAFILFLFSALEPQRLQKFPQASNDKVKRKHDSYHSHNLLKDGKTAHPN